MSVPPRSALAAAALSAAAALAAAGCQTVPPDGPAVLAVADTASLDALRAAISSLKGGGRVDLGAGDLTQSSQVSVLPPPPGPLEGRNPGRPEMFEIAFAGGQCVVRRSGGAESRPLAGIACKPQPRRAAVP